MTGRRTPSFEACSRVALARGLELMRLKFRGSNRYYLVSNDVRVRLGLRAAAETARKYVRLSDVASLLDA